VASAAARNEAEHTGYLGLPLVLLVVVLAVLWRRSAPVRLGAAVALAGLVCSLGPRLDVDGHLSSIPLPEALLAHLPLLSSVIPSRFDLEVSLGVAVVVAVGLDRTLATSGLRSRRGALCVAAAVLALACYLPHYPLASRPLPEEHDVLAALRATVPPGGVVLSYPYALPPYDEAMLWQAVDSMRFALMGGYVTVRGAGNGGEGQYWPPLLAPGSVQERFELDELGRPLHYPRPALHALGSAALCTFLDRYDVSAVVMRLGRLVPRQALVARSLVGALGPPQRFGGGALAWRPVGSSGGSAGAGGSGSSAAGPRWTCRSAGLRLGPPRPGPSRAGSSPLSSSPSGG
jgi:hypothetical protein